MGVIDNNASELIKLSSVTTMTSFSTGVTSLTHLTVNFKHSTSNMSSSMTVSIGDDNAKYFFKIGLYIYRLKEFTKEKGHNLENYLRTKPQDKNQIKLDPSSKNLKLSSFNF